MKRIQFQIEIQAPAEKVFSIMLALETYAKWTAAFNPASTFEGNWEKGAKMYFLGVDENGKKGGMVSEIIENIPNRFISIRHYGFLDGEKEITEGPEVEPWAGGLENYTFSEKDGCTKLQIELDTTDEYQEYYDGTWPKALNTLKSLCEE